MIQAECHYGKVDTGPAPSTFVSNICIWKNKKPKSATYKDRDTLKHKIMDFELPFKAAMHVYLFFDNCDQFLRLYNSEVSYTKWPNFKFSGCWKYDNNL